MDGKDQADRRVKSDWRWEIRSSVELSFRSFYPVPDVIVFGNSAGSGSIPGHQRLYRDSFQYTIALQAFFPGGFRCRNVYPEYSFQHHSSFTDFIIKSCR